MSKNIINTLDKYQDSKPLENFKKKPKNPKKKHIKTTKRKRELVDGFENLDD